MSRGYTRVMDDLKKKAIAVAAKEILKRPYSQISSGIPLDSWPLRDRVASAAACSAAIGGVWLWGGWGPYGSFCLLVAAVLMAVAGFMQPGWTATFLGIARRNKD